ncbi:MAG: hypothetical protein FJ404_03810 [Verrucomicrobia bacterium]|nr:hypothetical protein [Verrucomicrobiota bacterium]
MKLDESQRQKVSSWIQEGLQLGDIQKRLDKEWGLILTYMEVRFLLDDLKLAPKDVEKVAAPPMPNLKPGGAPPPSTPPPPPSPAPAPKSSPPSLTREEAAPMGNVSVVVDRVTRPGAVASGQVKFSDGKAAQWYLDQMGRLGLVPEEKGYKPSPSDLQSFQASLESELSKLGF